MSLTYMVPSDEFGCGHYRVLYPMRTLLAQGHDVRVIDETTGQLEDSDDVVVVFQRPMTRDVATETIPFLRAHGVAVVVEMDDNLSRIHPHHAGWYYHQPQYDPTHNYEWLEESARQADLVTATTQSLLIHYAPHGRGVVIPNYLPDGFLTTTLVEHESPYRLGWAGQTATHPGDLDVAVKAIRQVTNMPHWVFRTIGFEQTLKDIGVRGECVPWLSMDEYPVGLREFSLGVVPLRQHIFNEGKSYLKGLEYAAAGVPFVASNTEPYRRLAKMGAGVTANARNDWAVKLKMFASSASYRADMRWQGLAAVQDQTYELNAWRFAEAWDLARANYRASPVSRGATRAKVVVREPAG